MALVRGSIVVTYHIKLIRTWADRRNGILMSLPLLVTVTIVFPFKYIQCEIINLVVAHANFLEKVTFGPDTRTYLCVSRGKKY